MGQPSNVTNNLVGVLDDLVGVSRRPRRRARPPSRGPDRPARRRPVGTRPRPTGTGLRGETQKISHVQSRETSVHPPNMSHPETHFYSPLVPRGNDRQGCLSSSRKPATTFRVRVTSGIISAVSNGEIRRFRKFQNPSVLEKRRFPIIDEPKYGGSRVDKM